MIIHQANQKLQEKIKQNELKYNEEREDSNKVIQELKSLLLQAQQTKEEQTCQL